MKVVIWTRVSTREQKEGYSLDAQIRATRERAEKSGFTVVREFSVAESAKQGAERDAFHEMISWVRAEAKRGEVQGILAHKLDRTCRNMGDAVLLQGLENECGVRLFFCENQFGPGAAGTFSFNVLAAVGQYYSDNLRSEVLKGMHEKVRQGWPMGRASFGYRNVPDEDCPVIPDPDKSRTVVRIFELFAGGDVTFDRMPKILAAEGHVYRPTMPRFYRSALAWILHNRIYMGEIEHDGKIFASKVQPLISRQLFQACQDILQGRNRRTGKPEIPFGGGFFRCGHCGAAMTGEVIRKKRQDGGRTEYLYYKCGSDHKAPGHPSIRWRGEDLETSVAADLDRMRITNPDRAAWLRTTLEVAFADTDRTESEQRRLFNKQLSEITNKLDRLLSAYLEGMVDQAIYQTKQTELKQAQADTQERIERFSVAKPDQGKLALKLFDFSQKAGEVYKSSKSEVRRQILTAVTSNRTLNVGSLCLTKRRPFDLLIEGPSTSFGRGDRIRTCDLLVPNQTL